MIVIINPVSGTGGRAWAARRRVDAAASLLAARRVAAEIVVTERPGHARELARAALDAGVRLLAAWGGDGTVNEVASVIAFSDAALAIIPSGSGNGLARELRIPFDPRRAFDVAVTGSERVIDAGELDRRLFFNIAGIGLDARVAHRFAAEGLLRRGFLRYLQITVRELAGYCPDTHTVVVDGVAQRERALLVALANGRQYGNGARIAPHARPDDGRLDVVVVAPRPMVAALLQLPFVFTGGIAELNGVTIRQGTSVEITSGRTVLYHVDGEPFVGSARLSARVRPGALRVRVPGFT